VAIRRVGIGPSTGTWDAVAVSAILVNLLENAARFSPPGTPIIVAATPGRDGVEVVVCDAGDRVPDMELGTMLVGDRAAASGRRMGLQASHRLADEMGGCMWATDEPGGGSAFHLWLPAPQRHTACRLVEEARSWPTAVVSAVVSAGGLPRAGLRPETSSRRQPESQPRCDLSGRNLSAVNLSGDDRREADFHDATVS
jgi:two-component system sensor histidine kinase KdpD